MKGLKSTNYRYSSTTGVKTTAVDARALDLKAGDRNSPDLIQKIACKMASIKPCTLSSRMTDRAHSYWFTSAKRRLLGAAAKLWLKGALPHPHLNFCTIPKTIWIWLALIGCGRFLEGVGLFFSSVVTKLAWGPVDSHLAPGLHLRRKALNDHEKLIFKME